MAEFTSRPTLVHHFRAHVQFRPERTCLWFHRDGVTTTRTWREVGRDVARAESALRTLGIDRGDRAAFISPNRYEWIVVDLAILGLGAVHVPIHNSLTGPQYRFQIVDADVKLLVVAGDEQRAKLRSAEPLPAHVRVASLDPTTSASKTGADAGDVPWPRLFDLADELTDGQVDSWCESSVSGASPNELATILYTSGTTGDPKGVMLSHRNLTSNAEAMVAGFGGPQDERRLNLLPFSHIFARTCDLYCWLVGGSQMALADSPQTAIENAAEFAPRMLNAVPYFYERVKRKLVELGMADEPGILPGILGGNIEYCCSGGAPLPAHLARFFNDRGVLLVQGYGLTETSPVATMNTHQVYKHDTVGRPIADVEIRIADDGEVLVRGPNVMLGYWKRPAETAAALDGGWFHTGDVGSLDEEGYLRITGRKKELIVTSGGKKIVPCCVEALLTADPLVRQCAVFGDGRDYLTALVFPEPPMLLNELRARGIDVADEAAARAHPQAAAIVGERIRQRLAVLSHYEQVRKFTLIEREFSVERDEMTLTMKMRREQIAANFADVIETMYR